jgi:hypothetical protein
LGEIKHFPNGTHPCKRKQFSENWFQITNNKLENKETIFGANQMHHMGIESDRKNGIE